jgi:hypothetical protein
MVGHTISVGVNGNEMYIFDPQLSIKQTFHYDYSIEQIVKSILTIYSEQKYTHCDLICTVSDTPLEYREFSELDRYLCVGDVDGTCIHLLFRPEDLKTGGKKLTKKTRKNNSKKKQAKKYKLLSSSNNNALIIVI